MFEYMSPYFTVDPTHVKDHQGQGSLLFNNECFHAWQQEPDLLLLFIHEMKALECGGKIIGLEDNFCLWEVYNHKIADFSFYSFHVNLPCLNRLI